VQVHTHDGVRSSPRDHQVGSSLIIVTDRTEAALATYRQMVATRDRIEGGELPWSALADYFTENAVYIDSAWGRFEGLSAIRQFMADSMMGLEDWRFPEDRECG